MAKFVMKEDYETLSKYLTDSVESKLKEYPACVDCFFCVIVERDEMEYYHCGNPATDASWIYSVVTGKAELYGADNLCDKKRDSDGDCGIEGKLFQAKSIADHINHEVV